MFRAIDAEIGAHPFHHALLFTFQAVGTIGWGDIRANNMWSQTFCTLYTIFGVPIFFSALANVGRLISDFYTLDWLFLTCVVRPEVSAKIWTPYLSLLKSGDEPVPQQHISLRKSLYLLCIHQFIGVLLYGSLLKNYSPVAVIYFWSFFVLKKFPIFFSSITSMATIGVGDIHPNATNLVEALVAIIFLGVGMILLAALLIALAYHFQTLFFVYFRGWLLRKIEERK